jgi:hypothetical protein
MRSARLPNRRAIAWSILLVAALMTLPVRAADKLGNSLDFVPADASFYSTSLRLREQFDLLVHSKAWAKLLEMQSVQMALNMARSQWEQPGGPKDQWETFIRNPDNERLVETLKDMASNEVFIYGDKRFADFLGLSIEAFNAARYAPMFSKLVDPQGAQNDEQVAMAAFLQTLNENLDRVVVPDVVIGFKVSDTNRADQQVRRLETLINVVIGLLTINEFKDRFGRVKVGDGEFIEMRLDGKLVPWEELPFADFEENPGDFEPLKQRLRSLTMTLDLGVKDGYLIFSIGDSNEHVAQLGKTDLLKNRPEFKPLAEHLSKRLTEVSFTSKEFNALITGTKEDVDGLVDLAEEMLPYAELPDELEERLLEDARALANDLKPFVPEPGGSLSFSYLTPQGYEGFTYDWTQNLMLDDSQPLPLMRHTGGSPILAWVGRSKQSPQDYDVFVKWIKKGYGYFEEFGVPQMSDAEREKFKYVMDFAIPQIKRIDHATRTMLIPALADGQTGFVLDADITSKRWHKEMPPATEALPMIELALTFGVSDAELLKRGMNEYLAVAQAVADKLKEVNPGSLPPNYRIPDPTTREVSGGSVYSYELPADAGLDPQLQPAAGLSKTVAVLSLSPRQAERILQQSTLNSDLVASRKNLGSAMVFDFAGLVDAVRPWVEYGVKYYAVGVSPGEDVSEKLKALENEPQMKFVLGDIRTGAEILKCLKGSTSITYLEGEATVTKSVTRIEDLK